MSSYVSVGSVDVYVCDGGDGVWWCVMVCDGVRVFDNDCH